MLHAYVKLDSSSFTVNSGNWLQVRTLGVIPSCVVEDSEHGHNAIGVAICPPNVAACRSDVVHCQPNPASTLGDARTLFQCVVDALQFHHNEVHPSWQLVTKRMLRAQAAVADKHQGNHGLAFDECATGVKVVVKSHCDTERRAVTSNKVLLPM